MQVAVTNQRTFIDICDESRKSNVAVFGIKNTGKAFTMIPGFFDQDLKDKDKGITIVVNTPELAWYLYGMAKIEGRKADLLKPSIKFEILNNLLFKNGWDYDSIKKIYDFEKSIKEKRITIIDMEEEKYGEKAIRATSMLLLQLQAEMVTEKSKKSTYSVYIDDAGTYLPYLKNLLKYGDFYGFMTTLFFKSREELGSDVIYLDSFVRNFILLQGINYADAKYFAERMNFKGNDDEDGAQFLMNRDYGSVIVEYIENKTFKRKVEEGSLIEFSEDRKKEFMARGLQYKKKHKEVDKGKHHYQLISSAALLDKTIGEETYVENIKDDIDKTLVDNVIEDEDDDNYSASSLFVFDDDDDDVSDEPVRETPSLEEAPNKVEFAKPEETNNEEKKEPQLNRFIKPVNVKTEKRTDFSLLDEFDFPEDKPKEEDKVEPDIDFGGFEISEEEFNPDNYSESDFSLDFDEDEKKDDTEPVEMAPQDDTEFSLDDDETTFSIGGSNNRPYRKISNPGVENSLKNFKI